MDFLNDPLIFTQSDMDESNFALDENQRVCMFDFRDVGVLPESFASYTLGDSANPFIKSVAMHLDWVNDRNRGSMARAGAFLQTSSDATVMRLSVSLLLPQLRSALTLMTGLTSSHI